MEEGLGRRQRPWRSSIVADTSLKLHAKSIHVDAGDPDDPGDPFDVAGGFDGSLMDP